MSWNLMRGPCEKYRKGDFDQINLDSPQESCKKTPKRKLPLKTNQVFNKTKYSKMERSNSRLPKHLAYPTNKEPLAQHSRNFLNMFDIQFSPGAIQKTLKNIEVTWKTVTPIPHKWNEAAFLQEQHNYVLNRVTNIGHNLIFIDEHKKTGKAATLKINARESLINLIGAMLEGEMIYFKLLNKDGKKKMGMTSINICKFLVRLQDHCPAQSIIIMDNTRIHSGDNFKRVKNLLKESTKKIHIEFLPKYLLFLNPIELAFNIKTQIKHKEIKSQSERWQKESIKPSATR
ncbi:hypothetical protein VP01_266g3 [Puccinia sorghi]|uniref:Tc1-like transposase DDE domain-containing protein n=1 Tax=Puccinia sorghi TaxID=27349 RepID=A0A0L6V3W7_9BASI|nr:hypothetical protein VP01_266g3 [Puccinia sorghi]